MERLSCTYNRLRNHSGPPCKSDIILKRSERPRNLYHVVVPMLQGEMEIKSYRDRFRHVVHLLEQQPRPESHVLIARHMWQLFVRHLTQPYQHVSNQKAEHPAIPLRKSNVTGPLDPRSYHYCFATLHTLYNVYSGYSWQMTSMMTLRSCKVGWGGSS